SKLVSANRCLFGLKNHFRSRLLYRKTKIIIYKVLLQLVLMYGSETWTLQNKEPDIIKLIKIRRLEWAEYILHASEQRTVMKTFKTMPEGTRKIGRSKTR
ncbi:hypothetical protein C0J52_03551, partial [Blattella germanica]